MRSRQILKQGWLIGEVDAATADITALSRAPLHRIDTWMPAEMPAQVHDVLFAQGRIPNSASARTRRTARGWARRIGSMSRPFHHRESRGPVFLRMDGLDTVASVYLNGQQIGSFKDMNRRYAVEVSGRMKTGSEKRPRDHF